MAFEGGNLKSTSINGVKLYSVASQQRSLATWLNPKKLLALRKDKDYTSRVDLVKDLRFDIATSKIKATPDGEFLIAVSTYPLQVKVYELRELSLKFKRHFDSEIIAFQMCFPLFGMDFKILDNDYSKLAFMCADRSIVLHAKYGEHYSLVCGYQGWEGILNSITGRLTCFVLHPLQMFFLEDTASSPDVYRINLQQEVTALAFDDMGGFQMAVGSGSGKEELEEGAQTTIYDDFNCLTKEELREAKFDKSDWDQSSKSLPSQILY